MAGLQARIRAEQDFLMDRYAIVRTDTTQGLRCLKESLPTMPTLAMLLTAVDALNQEQNSLARGAIIKEAPRLRLAHGNNVSLDGSTCRRSRRIRERSCSTAKCLQQRDRKRRAMTCFP